MTGKIMLADKKAFKIKIDGHLTTKRRYTYLYFEFVL